VTAIGYVATAPIFVNRVEADLEDRVPDELAAAGFSGLTAAFSGQDGTLSCDAPLGDPEAARQAAYDVWGVRSIDLDRSCRVNTGDDSDAAASTTAASTTSVADTEPGTAEESSGDAAATTVASTSVPAVPTFETVAAAVAGSPQLSLLTVLLEEAGLAADLADPNADPITLFAPNDTAFESLPADTLAELRSDPETLRMVLVHHMTPGRLSSSDLVSGQLEMSDGALVDVDADAPSIAGIPISVTDIDATTGVVHIIDGVIVPDELDLTDPVEPASVDVRLEAGAITLSGMVATEAVRATLVAAAEGPDVTVTDELMVDAGPGLDAESATPLASLIEVLRTRLSAGSTGFDGEELYLDGTLRSESDRAAAELIATAAGVEAALAAPTEATDDDEDDDDDAATVLEDELNVYVTANPILFEPGSAQITAASAPVLDRIVELALPFDGLTITVQGHTDSDGDADQNLVLSRLRALAVEQALVARGLGDDSVDFEGFGSEQPVLDASGVEDKVASRRVQFQVNVVT
jgi:OOP family OmpA-OmpF porin